MSASRRAVLWLVLSLAPTCALAACPWYKLVFHRTVRVLTLGLYGMPDGVPHEINHPLPWFPIRLDSEGVGGEFYNLHALLKRPDWGPVLRKLGFRTAGPVVVAPPPAVINKKLAALGSPFRIAAVPGEIRLYPWLDLMAVGKLPIGDAHDLMTHAVGSLLMPPKIGFVYQGQVGFLRKIRDTLPMPPAVKDLVKARMEELAHRFEGQSYAIGSRLVQTPPGAPDYRDIVRSHQLFLGLDSPKQTAGAPQELLRLKKEIGQQWRELGFENQAKAREFNRQLDKLLGELQRTDPGRYSQQVNDEDVDPLVRQHYHRLLTGGPP